MTIESAIARVDVVGFGNDTDFVYAQFRNAYNGSSKLANKIEEWLSNHPGQNIRIEYYPPDNNAFGDPLGGGRVRIGLNFPSTLCYIDVNGNAVRYTFLGVLVHELGHAIGGWSDSNSSPVFTAGSNVANVNRWFEELGIPQNVSYIAQDVLGIPGAILTPGEAYTNGEHIDGAITGRYFNNIDVKAEGGSGSYLLFGTDDNGTYGGTDSRDHIYGNGGDDVLRGYAGNDRIFGGTGEDVIYGGEGDDVINGGDNSDILWGDEGDDIIVGGSGSNRIEGGAGRDNILGGDDVDLVEGGDDDDSINGEGGNDVLLGQAGNDLIAGGSGNDILEGNEGDDQLLGDDGEDRIRGGAGNDVIVGGGDNDDIRGEAGNDTIVGGDGDDVIEGGDNFYLFASDKDNIVAGDGDDIVDGGADDDTINGGAGDDILWGEDGNDLIAGGEDDDVIRGHDGNDRLLGDGGFDTIYGGNGDDLLVGGAEADTLNGDNGKDTIDAGAGNDVARGGDDDDTIIGGADDDTVIGEGGSDTLIGGSGADVLDARTGDSALATDKLYGGNDSDFFITDNGDEIYDLALGDRGVSVAGFLLRGGKREDDSGPYEGEDGEIYSLNGTTLTVTVNDGFVIDSTIIIYNFRNGAGGINLSTEKTDDKDAKRQASPIVIDLDGDGLELTTLTAGAVYFDLDGNGTAERTSWVRPDDGLLAIDWDQDGLITSGYELFRPDFSREDYDAGIVDPFAFSAFDDLRQLDSNYDGKVDANDERFGELKIWQDANGDAITDTGELKTLTEAGIASIGVTFARVDQDLGNGIARFDRSRATRSDGRVVEASDIFFAVSGNDAVGDVTNPDVSGLPFMIGQGKVVDLHAAMSRDPLLRDMVSELATLDASQASEIISRTMDIVLRWTGADKVRYDSRGGNVNGQWLHALEQLNGRPFVQVGGNIDPLPNAGSIIAQRMNEYVGYVAASLFTQTVTGQAILPSLRNAAAVEIEADQGTTLEGLLTAAAAQSPTDVSDVIGYWQLIIHALESSAESLGKTEEQVRSAVTALLPSTIAQFGYERVRSAIWTTELLSNARGNGGFATGFNPITGAGNGQGAEFSNNLYVISSATRRVEDNTGSERYIVSGQNIDVVIADYLRTYTSGNISRQQDIVHFEESVFSDLSFSAVPSDNQNAPGQIVYDLIIEDVSRNIRITVEYASRTGSTTLGIESLILADGQTVGIAEILNGLQGSIIYAPGDGATVNGTMQDETFIGSDTNDVYTFGPTSGQDRLLDSNSGDNDTITINANLADVSFSAPSGYNRRDLYIELGANNRLVVQGQYSGTETVIKSFIFADGQQLTDRQVTALLIGATFGDDEIKGTIQEDELDGLGGNDRLQGRDKKDTYIFRAGSGHDTIIDRGENRLVLENIAFADIAVGLAGMSRADIRIAINDNDSVTLFQAVSKLRRDSVVTEFVFSDGIYTLTDIVSLIEEPGDLILGTEFSDILSGTAGNDTFDGLAGSDILEDAFGNDSYRFGYGSGHDVIDDAVGNDTLLFGSGIGLRDLEFSSDGFGARVIAIGRDDSATFNGELENIRSEDGGFNLSTSATATNRFIFDELYDSTITPGDGTDLLVSGGGNQVIELSANFGTKIVYDNGGSDTISFASGIARTDVAFSRDGHDLILTLVSNGGTLVWRHYFEAEPTGNEYEGEVGFAPASSNGNYDNSANTTFEQILFANGDSISRDEVDAMFFEPSSADQIITRNRYLTGGAGNDILLGDDDNNVYEFGLGDGHDIIRDYGNLPGNGGGQEGFAASFGPASDFGDGDDYGYDELVFTDNIALTDVIFTRSGDYGEDIVITHLQTGDSITIDREMQRWDGQTSGNIEGFVFQDQYYSSDEIYRAIVKATPFDDVIQPPSRSIIIDALQGNDLIETGTSGAYVVFAEGRGHDVLRFAEGAQARAGAFDISGFNALEYSTFDSVYANGGIDLKITSRDGSSSLLIEGGVYARFADGTEGSTIGLLDEYGFQNYTINDLLSGIHGFAQGGEGDDVITGTANADVIVAGRGNDRIYARGVSGGVGVDRVLFGRGDGHDVVAAGGIEAPAGLIQIELAPDILLSDIRFTATSDGYVEMALDGGLDTVRVRSRETQGQGVDNYDVAFGYAGDSVISIEAVIDDLTQGTAGNDVLLSDYRDHTLDGGAGDDILIGNGGNNIYRFDQGYGIDTIRTTSSSGADIVEFGSNIALANLVFEYGGEDQADLVISIAGTNDRLVIEDYFVTQADAATGDLIPVSSFHFADGSTLSWQQAVALTRGVNTAGNDVVEGLAGGSELSGGAGNDELRGGTGNDLYRLERGFGSDTVIDKGGDVDTVRFGVDINPANTIFSRKLSNPNDLLIEVDGLERLTMTVKGQFNGQDNRIEAFEFEDGTVFTWQEVQDIILQGAISSGGDVVLGYDGDDLINALQGDDLIYGGRGNDTLIGGEGIDAAQYLGSAWEYDIVADGDDWIITPKDWTSDEIRQQGTDRLVGIEQLRFFNSNESYNLKPYDLSWSVGNFEFTMDEDQRFTFTEADIRAQISNPGNADLTITIESFTNSGGGVWRQPDGSYVFEPGRNFSSEYNGPDSFYILISDGLRAEGMPVAITINPVNDAPEALSGSEYGLEDTVIEGYVDAYDPDGDIIAFTLAQGPAHGQVTLDTETGDYRYLGNSNYFGTDSFVVTVSDGNGGSRDVTVDLELLAVADAPIVANALGPVAVFEDQPIDFSIPADSFADAENDALSLTSTLADGSPLPSWLSFENGRFTGTPPANFNGTIALVVTASDGSGSASSIFDFVINPVNDAPFASNDSGFVTDEDVAITISAASLIANDSDVEGDALTLSAVSSAIGGAVTLVGGEIEFTPDVNFYGEASFTYTASDTSGANGEGLVSITVLPVNDAPISINEIADVVSLEDETVSFAFSADAFSDVDGDALAYTVMLANGDPLPNWLTFDGQQFSGTPPLNYNGVITIAAIASDGVATAAQQFTLTIAPQNDAPVVGEALADRSSLEDQAISIMLPQNAFADIDGDALVLSAILSDGSALPSWLAFADGQFTGTPPSDFNGFFDIEVTARDGSLSASDTFRLTVTAVNDAPVVAIALIDRSSAEDTGIDFTIPADSFTDVDSVPLILTATLASGAALPSWLAFDAASRRFTGTPPANFNGAIAVRVAASDGALSVSDEFALTITPVNDAPTATNDSGLATGEGIALLVQPATLLANDNDLDGDTLSIVSVGAAVGGTVSLNAQGQIVYTPNSGYLGNGSFSYTISDGTLTATATASVQVGGSWVYGTNGNDNLYGQGNAINRIDGLAGDDLITGGNLNDELVGGLGNDRIYAGAGNDSVNGGDGNDEMTGDAGDDLLVGGIGLDKLYGGQGNDVIDAGDGNDTATGDDGNDVISGGAGDDLLYAGAGNDSVDGGAGNDTITGDAGIDNLTGGAGNDTISGGTQNDVLSGGDGNDKLYGEGGNDLLTGGAGNDIIDGTDGIDTVDYSSATVAWTINLSTNSGTSGAETDTIWNMENVIGGSGNDTITGNAAANALSGGDGNDILNGGNGNDALNGDAGDDIITGGTGNDAVSGGTGTDRLVLAGLQSSYTISTVNGAVTIVDNQTGVDGNDGTDSIASIEQLQFKGGTTVGVTSPIILDLDGNGVKTVSAADSNARYDLDGDGLADDTSWFGNTEGMLFLDLDGNGTVSNAGEFSFIDDVVGAKSDLDGLRAFDSNKDGLLSSLDAKFAEFKIWQDRDGDGVAEAGEILSLTQASVRSIKLTGTAVNGTTQLGDVAVVNKGSYTRSNGTTMEFLDAALTYFSSATIMSSIAVQEQTFARKADKYKVTISGGAMTLAPKKGQIDPRAGALGASNLMTFNGKSFGLLSPIILDLDGDGIEMKSIKKSKAAFDMNGDGVADDTGWTGKGDGFLVIDRNNDGKITHASELSFAAEDKNARSDLEALAALDNNGDRVLNKEDARFGELKVWVDANGNGVTDIGELKTLDDLGITEIGLAGRNIDGTAKVGDNVLISTATFTRTNGAIGTLGNAALAYKPGSISATIDGIAGSNSRFALPERVVGDDVEFEPGGIINQAIGARAATQGSAADQAAAILRGGSAGNGLGLPQIGMLENGRDIVNIFDYYEQPDATTNAGISSGNVPTTLRLADLVDAPMLTQDLPVSVQVTDVENLLSHAGDPLDPSARLVALMVQDMSAFGAKSGENDLSWRRDGARPVDYFA